MRFTDHRPNQPRQAARGPRDDDQARHDAHAELMGHLGRLTRNGTKVPCLDHRAVWAANDDQTQRACAAACLRCPALTECAAYLTAYPEPAGVWAGLTEKQRGG